MTRLIAKMPAAYGVLLTAALLASPSQAQVTGYGRSSAPIYGGTGISNQASAFRPMEGTFVPSHKSPDGKACISVYPSAKPQIINPKIIDQIVMVNNSCGQSIKVQVCYVGSTDCIIVPLNGYQKLQRVLGIAAGSSMFRFEYRELF